MRKKFIASAAVLALLMNSPQVSAEEDVVIFGGEFDNETPAQKKIDKPAPKKELPPKPKDAKPKDKPPENKPLNNLPPQQPVEKQNVKPPVETDQPFKSPSEIAGNQKTVDEPYKPAEPTRQIVRDAYYEPQEDLETLKPRFIKLAVDETYTYYLDKSSVQWKKMPYSSSEYIADVWIRMVERQPKALDSNMAAYGADNFRAEIDLARERGYQYSPEDLKVLRRQAYVLEHYYLRPKTKQIQFLCELEVFGRPQNTINERAYDYQNWENLVPGSVESIIYAATIKTIGKAKASERGHMNFFDILDEYARIALG